MARDRQADAKHQAAFRKRRRGDVSKLKSLAVHRLVYKLGTSHRHKRCEADVLEATARWRTMAGKDYRCELGALFLVKDRYFCKRHAGDFLIKELIAGERLVE